MNLEVLTPAEIDQLWIDATADSRMYWERANEQSLSANRYAKAGGHYKVQAERYAEKAKELREKSNELYREESAPYQAEWDRRGGWTRAYVVPDGHIHKSTCCHTLYPTTLISWLPDQSGLSEEEIVKHAGVHACTVCYPTAPVEELRAAEAAAKKAAQCPGSGEYVRSEKGMYRRYVTCPHCNKSVSKTSRGLLRAHKPE